MSSPRRAAITSRRRAVRLSGGSAASIMLAGVAAMNSEEPLMDSAITGRSGGAE